MRPYQLVTVTNKNWLSLQEYLNLPGCTNRAILCTDRKTEEEEEMWNTAKWFRGRIGTRSRLPSCQTLQNATVQKTENRKLIIRLTHIPSLQMACTTRSYQSTPTPSTHTTMCWKGRSSPALKPIESLFVSVEQEDSRPLALSCLTYYLVQCLFSALLLGLWALPVRTQESLWNLLEHLLCFQFWVVPRGTKLHMLISHFVKEHLLFTGLNRFPFHVIASPVFFLIQAK